jgi:hypothetical protein
LRLAGRLAGGVPFGQSLKLGESGAYGRND